MSGLRTASENDLIATLRDLFREIHETIYLVVDALDECTQMSGLMLLLGMIHRWDCDRLRLLVISRKERLIEDTLGPLYPFQINLNEMVNPDIETYIQNQLSTSQRLLRWTRIPEIRQKIQQTLSAGANGM